MADKLVVEFYCDQADKNPFASVLVLHGGDNPASAALTLADFLCSLRNAAGEHSINIGLAAAQFIIWANTLSGDHALGREVFLLPNGGETAYQVARLYPGDPYPLVEIMQDVYSSEAELNEAKEILRYLPSASNLAM